MIMRAVLMWKHATTGLKSDQHWPSTGLILTQLWLILILHWYILNTYISLNGLALSNRASLMTQEMFVMTKIFGHLGKERHVRNITWAKTLFILHKEHI